MALRQRGYLVEAKKETYASAQAKILEMLSQNGWTVKQGLKIPQAIKGEVKLWFKKEAVYASDASLSFGSARSLNLDIKKLLQFEPRKIAGFMER